MKKRIGVILLVSLLLASSVFAASVFTGKARLRLGAWNSYDYEKGLSKWTYGLMDKSDAKVNFIIDELIGNTTGEGKIFGEVNATAGLRLKPGNDVGFMSEWVGPNGNPGAPWVEGKSVQFKLALNYANIVFNKEKNLKLGISGTWPQPRYAQGWEVEIDNGNTIASDPFFTYATAFKTFTDDGDGKSRGYQARAMGGWIPAVTFTYDKYALSLALDGGINNNDVKDPGVVALLQGNGIELADNMSLSAAFGYMQSTKMQLQKGSTNNPPVYEKLGAQRHLLFGLGYKWNSDLVDLAVGLNGNVSLNNNKWVYDYIVGVAGADYNEQHGIEASLNFAYKGDFKVNLDAWFLDNLGLWANANEPDFVTYRNEHDLGYVYRRADGNFLYGWGDGGSAIGGGEGSNSNNVVLHKALSFKLALRPINALGITFRLQDVLNQGIYALELPIYITDAITLTPQFEFTSATNKKYKNGSWTLEGATANAIYEGMLGFNYAHDLFNLYASVRVGHETLGTKKDGKVDGSVYVRPYLDITSRALIDNCQLRLRWDSATFGNTFVAPSGKYHNVNTDANGIVQQAIGSIYLEARIDF
ncbi:MAG: hypothetical protein SPJ08_02785 [Sphaerochaetaceae bacterium]|nr:hypothetical protein [Spirochaetales bacterium]MDY5967917.1 hypothetical protein [Sphaerochaetaceae bacterium]